ncbi:MAG TPA: HEAT repeat domain-containing protein, partial [Phycisphaerae bacterium]|nr:HEAT repeat domain-containing protein [Phycisphaerae bacterium]
GEGDAGNDYWDAVQVSEGKFKALADIYQTFGERNYVIPPESMGFMKKVHEHVVKGAQRASATYATRFPEEIRVAPGFFPARGLKRVADVLFFLYMYYYYQKDYDRAEAINRDMFTMGWHLFNERGHANIAMVGLQMQVISLGGFEQLYKNTPAKKNPDAAGAEKKYWQQLKAIRQQYVTKMEILNSRQPHTGDLFNIAENDGDHGWRIQAVQMLGVVKFTAGRRGDQRYIRKLISRFSQSDDELLRAAAKAAGEFTQEDFDAYSVPVLTEWPPGVEHYD